MAHTSLTGAFNTGRISKIADEPITVTVSRTALPGKDAALGAWAERAVAMLEDFPGSLGVGVLRPGEPGGEWHVVFRFIDGLSLRAWERSPQRAALLAEVDELAVDMKVQRTVGVDNWFDLPERAAPKVGFLRRIVGDTLWVYPVTLTIALFIAPYLPEMAVWARVLVSGLLIGALTQLTTGPIRRRLRGRRFG
jgi:antibiotic biosynthesis monooxygenase (ABM) superfamily enzyme